MAKRLISNCLNAGIWPQCRHSGRYAGYQYDHWLLFFGMPAMFLFGFWADWGANGIWFSLCLGFGITSVLLWCRFVVQLRDLQTRPPLSTSL